MEVSEKYFLNLQHKHTHVFKFEFNNELNHRNEINPKLMSKSFSAYGVPSVRRSAVCIAIHPCSGLHGSEIPGTVGQKANTTDSWHSLEGVLTDGEVKLDESVLQKVVHSFP